MSELCLRSSNNPPKKTKASESFTTNFREEGLPKSEPIHSISRVTLLGKALLRKVFGHQQCSTGSEDTSNFDTCSIGFH